MKQEKIITRHLTDLSKMLTLGTIATLISWIFSPDYYFFLCKAIVSIGLIAVTAGMFGILIMFSSVELIASDGKLPARLMEVSKKSFRILIQYFIEFRERKVEQVEEFDIEAWRKEEAAKGQLSHR